MYLFDNVHVVYWGCLEENHPADDTTCCIPPRVVPSPLAIGTTVTTYCIAPRRVNNGD
jgi:hypothetical protein